MRLFHVYASMAASLLIMAGAQVVSAQSFGSYAYGSPSVSPALSPDVNAPAVIGSARFFGPLSAGCAVAYSNDAAAGVTGLGSLSSAPGTKAAVQSCTDSFTGLPIPYAVTGYATASDRFEVSSTATISTAASANVSFAYNKLTGSANSTDTDVFQLLSTGSLQSGYQILTADIQFITISNLVADALMIASGNNGTDNCKNVTAIQQALAGFVASAPSFDMTLPDHISTAIASFTTSPCLFNQSVVTAAQANSILIATAAGLFGAGAMTEGAWPLFDIATMAHFASLATTITIDRASTYTNSTPEAFIRAVDAASIVPGQICSSLGLPDCTPVQTTISAVYNGPLSGAVLTFTPFTQLANYTLAATDASGLTSNAAGTHGLYTIAPGAIDIFLTTDPSNPVRTLVPIAGLAGLTGSSARITISPIGALVLSMGASSQGEGQAIGIPPAALWKLAYEIVMGSQLSEADYFARTYVKGSGAALAVYAVDTLIPTLPTMGGLFLSTIVNSTEVNDVVGAIYDSMVNRTASDLSNVTVIVNILTDVYNMLTGNVTTSSAARRLLALSTLQMSQLTTVMQSIGTALAESATLATTIIAQAQTSISSGTTPPATLFTQLAQIASVQSTSLAAAITNVATLVAAGDFTAATTAAATVQEQFTGANLLTAISSARVNEDAIMAAITPDAAPTTTTTVQTSEKKSTVPLAVGLAVGLGVPVLAALAFMAYYVHKRRQMQATAPASQV